MVSGIKLVVGLGNPGQQYINTRHNVGFWAVQTLADIQHAQFKTEAKFKGLVSNIKYNEQQCSLLLPTTFMNLSGDAVIKIASFYKITPETILVVHDELDFQPGIVRLKQGGGANSHNGVQDIINKLASNNFWRARIGIGKPVVPQDASNYVLTSPPPLQQQQIKKAIDKLLGFLPEFITGKFDSVMNQLH